MTTGRAARILALTDGFSTEPLGDIGERLVRQRVSLDYRLVTPPLATDYGISDLRLPARVRSRASRSSSNSMSRARRTQRCRSW